MDLPNSFHLAKDHSSSFTMTLTSWTWTANEELTHTQWQIAANEACWGWGQQQKLESQLECQRHSEALWWWNMFLGFRVVVPEFLLLNQIETKNEKWYSADSWLPIWGVNNEKQAARWAGGEGRSASSLQSSQTRARSTSGPIEPVSALLLLKVNVDLFTNETAPRPGRHEEQCWYMVVPKFARHWLTLTSRPPLATIINLMLIYTYIYVCNNANFKCIYICTCICVYKHYVFMYICIPCKCQYVYTCKYVYINIY